jgi:hypothetical protein
MGPIETAVRKEVPEGSALAEIAYKLAFTLDEGDGSVAMVRELRSILDAVRERRPFPTAHVPKYEMQDGEWVRVG